MRKRMLLELKQSEFIVDIRVCVWVFVHAYRFPMKLSNFLFFISNATYNDFWNVWSNMLYETKFRDDVIQLVRTTEGNTKLWTWH